MSTGLVTGGVINPIFTEPVSEPVEELEGELTECD